MNFDWIDFMNLFWITSGYYKPTGICNMQWHTQHRDAYGCGEGWEDEEDEEDKDATLWPTFVDKFCVL